MYNRFFPIAFLEAGLLIPNTAIPTKTKYRIANHYLNLVTLDASLHIEAVETF